MKTWQKRLVAAGVAGALAVGGALWWQRHAGADWREAQAQIERGELAPAIVRLKAALSADPALGPARQLLGRALLRAGDAAGGQAEFERALGAGVPFSDVGPELADAMLAQGKAAELLQRLSSERPAAGPTGAQLDLRWAEALLAQGQRDEALLHLNRAREVLGPLPAIRLVEARALVLAGDATGALQLLDELLARQPESAAAWGLRGDLLRADPGRAAAAVDSYRKALAQDPRRAEDQASLVSLLMQTGQFDPARAQWREMAKALPGHGLTEYLDALLSLRENNLGRAREASQRLQRRPGLSPPMLIVAGQVEYKLGAWRQAETLFSRAMTQAPDLPAPRQHLATVLLRLGEPRRALAVLEPLLGASSQDATALGLAGRAWAALGNPAQATPLLDRALHLDPENTLLRIERAQAGARQGQVARSIDELRRLSAQESGTEAATALFRLQLGQRDFKAAEAVAQGLDARWPASPLAAELLAEAALARGDRAAARARLADALAKSPKHLPALIKLAELDLAEANPAGAKAQFERVLQLDASHPTALLGLAALAAREPDQADAMADWLKRAVERNASNPAVWAAAVQGHARAGQPDRALAMAQAAVAALPSDAGLVELLGSVQLDLGDRESALRSYRRLGGLLPATAESRLRVARLVRSTGMDGEADELVAQAVRLDGKSVEAIAASIEVALRQQEFGRGLALARSLQADAPDRALGWLFEGDIAVSRQRWTEALTAYAAALKLAQPGPAPAGYHNSLVGAGRAAEAEAFAATWLARHADDAAFRLYLAHRARAAGDVAAAESQLRALLQALPDHAIGLNDLASLIQVRKPQEALALAQRAVQQAPGVPAFRDTLAAVLLAQGQPAQALTEQRRAVQLAPRSGALRLNLARMLLAQNDRTQAARELDELARLGPGFTGQDEVARLRASLGLPAEVSARRAAVASPTADGRELWLGRAGAALGLALLVLGGMAVVAALQPAAIDVWAEREMATTAAAVFPWLQDLRLWSVWSGLRQLGPSHRLAFSTPSSGEGAHCQWTAAGGAELGSVMLMACVPLSLATAEVQTEQPEDDRFLWRLTLTPLGGDRVQARLQHLGLMRWPQRLRLLWVGRQRWLRRRLSAALERLEAASRQAPPEAAAPAAGQATG